jgi:ABC-type phosphate transport system substrate-binding protein
VNAGVAAVRNLSAQQVCDIYAGRATNWAGLDGPELEIAARTRPESEVDAEVVRAGVDCMAEQRLPPSVKVMLNAGEMASELATAAGEQLLRDNGAVPAR